MKAPSKGIDRMVKNAETEMSVGSELRARAWEILDQEPDTEKAAKIIWDESRNSKPKRDYFIRSGILRLINHVNHERRAQLGATREKEDFAPMRSNGRAMDATREIHRRCALMRISVNGLYLADCTASHLRSTAETLRRVADGNMKRATVWEAIADALPDDTTTVGSCLKESDVKRICKRAKVDVGQLAAA